MQQITRAIYIVEAGEAVTVEIEALKVGNFITFVLDGVLLTPVLETPRTYNFNVTVGANLTHFGITSVHFPSAAPDDAMFQIFVSGSMGGDRFIGSNIVKTDLIWSRDIQFRRV